MQTARRGSKSVSDMDSSNTLPPATPRVDASFNQTSMIEYVEFMDKQKYVDAKKEMQEKQKNIVLDFQNKLLSFEEKLKEEGQNQQYKIKCHNLEAELHSHALKAEEAKQLEQQLVQQVQQQRKLFEAFELETHRHNRAMSDHISDLEKRLAQQTSEREQELKEQKEAFECEIEKEHAQIATLQSELAALRSQLDNKTQLEDYQQETQSLNEKLSQAEELQQRQKEEIAQQQKIIEELNRTLQEMSYPVVAITPRSASLTAYDNTSPRSPRSLTTHFARKLFTKAEDLPESGTPETPEFLELRNKLKRVQSSTRLDEKKDQCRWISDQYSKIRSRISQSGSNKRHYSMSISLFVCQLR
jgi:myosin heavy subunit